MIGSETPIDSQARADFLSSIVYKLFDGKMRATRRVEWLVWVGKLASSHLDFPAPGVISQYRGGWSEDPGELRLNNIVARTGFEPRGEGRPERWRKV